MTGHDDVAFGTLMRTMQLCVLKTEHFGLSDSSFRFPAFQLRWFERRLVVPASSFRLHRFKRVSRDTSSLSQCFDFCIPFYVGENVYEFLVSEFESKDSVSCVLRGS